MYPFAGKCVEVHGQRGRQGFALTGAHFGNFPVVQGHATEQLHIKMPHFHDALGAFAHYAKCLRQKGIEGFTLGYALFEFLRLGTQRLIIQLFKFGLHRIDARHRLAVLLEKPIIAAAENFGEEVGGHASRNTLPAQNWQSVRNPCEEMNSDGTSRPLAVMATDAPLTPDAEFYPPTW